MSQQVAGGSGPVRREVMVVYGTRPEAIKLAPLVLALRDTDDFSVRVVVTGQHREMLDQVNQVFGIEPDIDLSLMSHGASVNAITRRVLRAMEDVLAREEPDLVVVQGDTTSAFAASMAAFLAGVPVAHVEAGLRTGDLTSPFPEEANRRLTAVLTRLHLAPTTTARDNLLREGVDPATVVVTGNTVIDALQWAVRQPVTFTDPAVAAAAAGRFVLVTTHRRESWGGPMIEAMNGLADVARSHPDLTLVVPLHRNEVVRQAVSGVLGDLPNAVLCEPFAYAEFAHLMNHAQFVVTDSGGVQEEAPGLGKPVLVLRDTTERPEGIAAGTARLVGTDREAVRSAVETLIVDPEEYRAMAHAVNPYGDGHASERCVQALRHVVADGPRPEEFAR